MPGSLSFSKLVQQHKNRKNRRAVVVEVPSPHTQIRAAVLASAVSERQRVDREKRRDALRAMDEGDRAPRVTTTSKEAEGKQEQALSSAQASVPPRPKHMSLLQHVVDLNADEYIKRRVAETEAGVARLGERVFHSPEDKGIQQPRFPTFASELKKDVIHSSVVDKGAIGGVLNAGKFHTVYKATRSLASVLGVDDENTLCVRLPRLPELVSESSDVASAGVYSTGPSTPTSIAALTRTIALELVIAEKAVSPTIKAIYPAVIGVKHVCIGVYERAESDLLVYTREISAMATGRRQEAVLTSLVDETLDLLCVQLPRLGLVEYDCKPANMLVYTRGGRAQVKLCDIDNNFTTTVSSTFSPLFCAYVNLVLFSIHVNSYMVNSFARAFLEVASPAIQRIRAMNRWTHEERFVLDGWEIRRATFNGAQAESFAREADKLLYMCNTMTRNYIGFSIFDSCAYSGTRLSLFAKQFKELDKVVDVVLRFSRFTLTSE